jgi:Zn-dependent M28 family amino/carboxypeptidase
VKITHSRKLRPLPSSPRIKAIIETVSDAQLRQWVEHIARPRHFRAEPAQNRATADWLSEVFLSMDYRVQRQGKYSNVLALPRASFDELILVGAHYDSVPMSPGADDNGSAIAAMLGCAAACSLLRPPLPVVFAAFNREEDGLLGSRDFVESFLPKAPFRVTSAHVLEMVGYASSKPGSQRIPAGLPVKIGDTGDFLGLLANGRSAAAMDSVLRHAGSYVPALSVMGLSVRFGMERFLPVLSRSDHVPFWARKIPAVMWTDTSEFRNHHYHRLTDTPGTLDYRFLKQVTQLLTACVIHATQ